MAAETDLDPAALQHSTPSAVPSTASHASCTIKPIARGQGSAGRAHLGALALMPLYMASIWPW